MNDPLADEIARVRFDPVRLRDGYDMSEVDWFLEQLESKVRAGGSIEELVAGAQFRTVRLREGYDIGEVDQFLDSVVQRSRAAATGPSPEPAPRATAPTTPPTAQSEGPPQTPPAGEAVQAGAVHEVRRPWERLFGRRRS